MANFSMSQKREHYASVAKGETPVKKDSKFSKKEQIAYAKGQRDARNESVRMYKYKNSTPEERAAYKQKRRADRLAYLASQAKK